jgi:hypothetical protein
MVVWVLLHMMQPVWNQSECQLPMFGLQVGYRKYVDLEAAAHMHGPGPLGGDINIVG